MVCQVPQMRLHTVDGALQAVFFFLGQSFATLRQMVTIVSRESTVWPIAHSLAPMPAAQADIGLVPADLHLRAIA